MGKYMKVNFIKIKNTVGEN